MFSHIMVGANDIDASKKFYDAVFGALGVPEARIDPKGRAWWRTKTGTFGITKPIDGKPAAPANGGTIGFACESTAIVDAWHAAGVANGGTSIESPPGLARGRCRQTLSRLPARPRRQQDLRDASR